jgi:hypothetical protein
VRRAFFCPKSSRAAAGLSGKATPTRTPRPRERMRAAERMIGQLDGVFTTYADKLTEQEVEGLDLEIKLLENEISGERKE